MNLKVDYTEFNKLASTPTEDSSLTTTTTKNRKRKRDNVGSKNIQERVCLYTTNSTINFLQLFCPVSYEKECKRHRDVDQSFEDFLLSTTEVGVRTTREDLADLLPSTSFIKNRKRLLSISEEDITPDDIEEYVAREIYHSIEQDRDTGGCYWFIFGIYSELKETFETTDLANTLNKTEIELIVSFLQRIECRTGVSQRMFTYFDSALVNAFKIWQLLDAYFSVRNDILAPTQGLWGKEEDTMQFKESNTTYQKKCANNYFKRKPMYTSMMHRSQAWWKSVNAKIENESFLLRTLIHAVSECFPIPGLPNLALLPGSTPVVNGKSGFSRKILGFYKKPTYNSLSYRCNRFADYIAMINSQTPVISCVELLQKNVLTNMNILPDKNCTKRFNTKKIKRSISSERDRMHSDLHYQRATEVIRDMKASISDTFIDTVYISDMSRYTLDATTNQLLLLPPSSIFPVDNVVEAEEETITSLSRDAIQVLTSDNGKILDLANDLLEIECEEEERVMMKKRRKKLTLPKMVEDDDSNVVD